MMGVIIRYERHGECGDQVGSVVPEPHSWRHLTMVTISSLLTLLLVTSAAGYPKDDFKLKKSPAKTEKDLADVLHVVEDAVEDAVDGLPGPIKRWQRNLAFKQYLDSPC